MFQTNVMLPVLPIYADPAHHAGGGQASYFESGARAEAQRAEAGVRFLGGAPAAKTFLAF